MEGRHPHVAGEDLPHTRAQTTTCRARVQARAAPAAGSPSLGPRRGWSPRAERGLPPLPLLLAAEASCSLPALAVGAWHIALCSRVLFKVQRVFSQCLNKRRFCGTENWLRSDGDGGRSGRSCGRLCQRRWQPPLHNARALPSTARSPLLSACGELEKSELIHAISFSGNILCSN